MKPKNIIYFGSPDFSAQILQSLLSPSKLEGDAPIPGAEGVPGSVRIVGIVTTPDASLGRKQIITPSSVAQMAARYDLPIFKPEKLDDAHLSHLKLLKPDIFLVVSYGKIIPSTYLTTPTIGTFNLHFSLLPKYRGALPISEAIKNGDTKTGVTLMVMDQQLDHGPIISTQEVTIDINDNVADLTSKLIKAAIKLLHEYLPILTKYHSSLEISNSSLLHLQDEAKATHTPSLKTCTRQSAFIPWTEIRQCLANEQSSMSYEQCLHIHDRIRSLNPEPGAWTRIPIVGPHHDAPTRRDAPTTEIEIKIIKSRLLNTKYLILDTIQLPGKSPISWANFLSGHKIV